MLLIAGPWIAPAHAAQPLCRIDFHGYVQSYRTVPPNSQAFAAFKADGSITAWGYSTNGGSGEPSDTDYVSINGVAAGDTLTATVTVSNSNDAPSLDQGIDNQNATEDLLFSMTVPNDAFADPDNSLSWSFGTRCLASTTAPVR